MRVSIVIGTLAFALLCAHCAADTFASATDGGHEDGPSVDASMDAAASDGSAESALPDAGEIDAPMVVRCASVHGPSMVEIPLGGAAYYCIDSTEVSDVQYATFLADPSTNLGAQGPQCAWNVSFDGYFRDAGPSAAYPITQVDHCDAAAFCKWAGKRLCGSIRGGPVDAGSYGAAATTTESQWFRACSQNGARVYPYGAIFDGTACDVRALSPPDVVPVGSLPNCVGGYPGIFDMSGNVEEWEDSCFPSGDGGPQTDYCLVRGGDFFRPEAYKSKCDIFNDVSNTGHPPTRNAKSAIGFRCCQDGT